MSDKLTLMPAMVDRADRITDYHQGCLKAFGQQMGYAFLCGLELNAAKEEIPHGQFLKWRESNLPQLSKGTTTNYMNFAEALSAKFPTVGNLKLDRLQLTNGDLPEKEREQVLKAVHQVADGKTLTQLYRDLGVIRQAEKPKHNPVTMTDEERLQADLNAAEALLQDAICSLALLRDQHDRPDSESIFTKAKPDTRRQLLELNTWCGKTLRKFTRRSNKKGSK